MKRFLQFKQYIFRPESLVILLSLGFTGLVSAVVGGGGALITGSFWGFFWVAFGIQFVMFAIINSFLQRKDLIEGTEASNKQLEALSKFVVKLTCSYCQLPNDIPIKLNQENRFECVSCNQVNGVKMQFFSTQITTPLNKVLLPVGENESVEFKTDLNS